MACREVWIALSLINVSIHISQSTGSSTHSDDDAFALGKLMVGEFLGK
jgi:hypothetical protein